MTPAEPSPSVTVTLEADGNVRSVLVFVPPSLSVTHGEVVRETVRHLNEWLARQETGEPEWSHGELR